MVRRLRAAGAPMLGKTALPELAMWGHMTESQTTGPRATRGTQSGPPAAPAAGPPPPWPPGLAPVGTGLRRWRLDPRPVGDVRAVWAQADTRAHLHAARPRALARPDGVRWPGPQRARRCAVRRRAARAGGRRRAHATRARQISFADAARREPGRLRVAVSLKGTLPASRQARLRGAPSRKPPSCCARSDTRSPSAIPSTVSLCPSSCRATSRAWPTTRPSSTTQSGSSAAPAEWRGSAGGCTVARCGVRCGANRRWPSASTLFRRLRRTTHACHGSPTRAGGALARQGRRAHVQRRRPLRHLHGDLELPRPARGGRAGRLRRGRPAHGGPNRRAGKRRDHADVARRPARKARPWADRRPPSPTLK